MCFLIRDIVILHGWFLEVGRVKNIEYTSVLVTVTRSILWNGNCID